MLGRLASFLNPNCLGILGVQFVGCSAYTVHHSFGALVGRSELCPRNIPEYPKLCKHPAKRRMGLHNYPNYLKPFISAICKGNRPIYGDLRSPWLLTTYKSWDNPPSTSDRYPPFSPCRVTIFAISVWDRPLLGAWQQCIKAEKEHQRC